MKRMEKLIFGLKRIIVQRLISLKNRKQVSLQDRLMSLRSRLKCFMNKLLSVMQLVLHLLKRRKKDVRNRLNAFTISFRH